MKTKDEVKKTDVMTPPQRRKAMQAMKSSNTKIEKILGKALWGRKLRYRKNDKKIYGKPDFTFAKYKIAIFVDGEFFHGYNWETEKYRIQNNRDFWWNKIQRNIQRDKEVNKILEEQGWTVLRFWGKQIKGDLDSCISEIEETILVRKG